MGKNRIIWLPPIKLMMCTATTCVTTDRYIFSFHLTLPPWCQANDFYFHQYTLPKEQIMQYAFMSFSTPEASLDDMLAIARQYGYSGIEPRLDSKHAHGIEVDLTPQQRCEVKEKINASGIKLSCLATSLSYADPAKTADMILQTHDRIDLAGDLGAPTIRVFGGVFPETISREEATDRVAEALTQIAPHAASRNVIVCLETHDAWCDPLHVAAIMQQVNHSAIAVNWDIMHPIRRGNASMDSAFLALKPWIRHLHIHDGPGDQSGLLPIGTGAIDHKRALELLKTIDYQGVLSGEWINWEDYRTHLPREIATMKAYEAEIA